MSMASPASASTPDVQPLPAGLTPLPQPQVAPPITRTEPAYVKYDLTTQKVSALLADGVAYEYWTFNGTVPGPMLRVREGDTVEIVVDGPDNPAIFQSIKAGSGGSGGH